jgi:hypothetical protein
VPHERPVIRTQSRRKKKTTDVSCLAFPIVVPSVGQGGVGRESIIGTLAEDGIQEDRNEKRRLTLAHVLSFAAINVLLRLI